MGADLATFLVTEAFVAADAMERALARQRSGGGALDTALLELDLIDEPSLVAALARLAELPPAPPPVLADPDPRIRRLLPARLAERHGIAPFRLDGRDLTVLASWPADLAALDEVSAMLSLNVAPHVAPEWRVRELNYRVYGTPLGERFAKLAAASRRAAAVGDPLAFDIAVVFELPPAEAPAPGDGTSAAWSEDEALAAVATARTGDEVVEAALRCARGAFEFAAFLAVGRDRLTGRDARGGGAGARERTRRFSRPVAGAGVLEAVVESGAPHVRRVPADDPLLAALGRGEPHTVLLQPIRLRGRVAGVLYADNGEIPVSSGRVSDLLVFAAALGPALERILRARKAAVE